MPAPISARPIFLAALKYGAQVNEFVGRKSVQGIRLGDETACSDRTAGQVRPLFHVAESISTAFGCRL
jgi:hypothetical protein